jgi:hypothetical protein
MVQFHQSPNPLLDSLEKVHKIAEGSELRPEKLADCQSDIEVIRDFFRCSEQQAVLLALLLLRHYHNEEPTVEDLLEHAGLKLSAAIHVHRLLKEFVDKEWMKPKQDTRYFPLSNYKFSSKFLHCVTTGDWSHLEAKPINNSFELIERFGKNLEVRKLREMTYSKFQDATRKLLNDNIKLPICEFIHGSDLKPFDTLVFLTMCYRHYCGENSFDFDCVILDIGPPLADQYNFRQQIKQGESDLLQLKLIRPVKSGPLFFLDGDFNLSETAIRSFNPAHISAENKIKSSLLASISHEKIVEKKLFYGDKERVQIERLHELLEPQRFDAFLSRMAGLNMKGGLTVLLYGVPGTGKTESVYQLARRSGRQVLAADVSEVRSKWVGETEKNIRQLFQDYKKARETFAQIPILLFNEADAILGKRRSTIDRVDQMENTLQNILLQELENFEGIFIATTNLEDNLDSAFDRRILYKVRFSLPSEQLRMSIWKDKLPDIPDELIQPLNAIYTLSGGQIENVCKKIEVDRLLDPELEISLVYLSALAEEEISFRPDKSRRTIGFIRNASGYCAA